MRIVAAVLRGLWRPALLTLAIGLVLGVVGGGLLAGISLAAASSATGTAESPMQTVKGTLNAVVYAATGRTVFRRERGRQIGGQQEYAETASVERAQRLAVTSASSGPVGVADRSPVPDIKPFTNIGPSFEPEYGHRGGHGPGVCLFDYDGDGRTDVFVANIKGNSLYRNEGGNAFRDVAEQAGVRDAAHFGVGCLAFDYDNDGLTDLYVTNRSSQQSSGMDPRYEPQMARNTLFRNEGDGRFVDVTEHAGVGEARVSFSAAAGDVNLDGYLDIYVSNFIDPPFISFWRPYLNGARNTLYLNNRDGTFTDVTDVAKVGTPPVPWFANDGQPKSAYNPNVRDDAGRTAGEQNSNSHASAIIDINGDRYPDIFVATDQGYLYLFRNDGPGPDGLPRFTDITHMSGFDYIGSWMGLSFADWDGDGRIDVFGSNLGSDVMINEPLHENVVSPSWGVRYLHSTHTDSIFRNDGWVEIPGWGRISNFSNISAGIEVRPSYMFPPEALDPSKIHPLLHRPSGLEAYEFAFGTVAPDVNNDGWPDLYFAGDLKGGFQSGLADLFPGPGRLLLNHGNWRFSDISYESRTLVIPSVNYETGEGLNRLMRDPAKGAATGDLNGDGYPEILVGTTGTRNDDRYGRTDRPGPLYVFMNPGGSNNWLKVRLKGRMGIDGTGTNAQGVGAVVRVTADVDGTGLRTQVLELQAGTSDLSTNEHVLMYGLGQATSVERVEVFWPVTGRTQTIKGVSPNQPLEIVEERA